VASIIVLLRKTEITSARTGTHLLQAKLTGLNRCELSGGRVRLMDGRA
jgi:hypothetical protein